MTPTLRRSDLPAAGASASAGAGAGPQAITLTSLRPGLERVVAAAVETAESTFRGLVEYAPVALVIVDRDDRDARIVHVNARAETLFGYQREELVGQPMAVLLPTLFDTGGVGALATTPAGGAESGTRVEAFSAHRKDGSTFPVEVGLSALETAQGLLVTAAIRDATEHHRVEQLLQEQIVAMREQAELLTLARDAIVVRDLHGAVLSWNQGAETLYGWTAQEVMGQTTSALLHTESPQPPRAIATALREQGWWDGELRHVRRDGTPLVVESRQVLVRDGAGASAAVLEVGRNVTERGWVVTSLQAAHDVLVARVRERTTDLARVTAALRDEVADRGRATNVQRVTDTRLAVALAELEQVQQQVIQQERLRAVGEMASGIAHDFNNALAPVVGFSELLLSSPGLLADDTRARRYLGLIHTGGLDAAATVRRLSEFYRPRASSEGVLPVDTRRLVADVIALTQPRWKDQAQGEGRLIRMTEDLASVPPVAGRVEELREVLTNLVFNAVDALLQGGAITLRARWAPPTPEAPTGWVVIEVQDDGVGMPLAIRQRCLEPFFTTKGERGSGLGLAMVYGVVRRHGGEVEIESAPGRGTTVRLKLPTFVAQAPTGILPVPVADAVPSLRVLVVDDEPLVRETTAAYLIADGHRVHPAAGGEAALEALDVERFDLVITDRAMPDLPGETVARAAAALGTPVILLTGFGDLITATDERVPGVDVVLAKPVTATTLRDAITAAVSGRDADQAPARPALPAPH